ncbi:malonyl-CoA decarboxylase [Pelagibius sp. 7325]|uniref:malonyl-CoA decarboxylase n=1 Tax=Pelagibius sp. 7325 TaxID=3131994 RepID=UPI0030EDA2CF
MSEVPQETLVVRTLSNLASAWRDIAQSAARTVGLAKAPASTQPESLKRLMQDCLEARGGEVSARMRAAALGRIYLEQDAEGRGRFLTVLAREFAVPADAVDDAIDGYRAATDDAGRMLAEGRLRRALQPPRLRLLTQFNALPEGVKFLVDLRADLLALRSDDPYLQGLDNDLRELLLSWFDTGFLDLREIDWDSPASLLEKLVAYEAVHQITSWQDLRNRLDSDRRCYALFHPRMPEEPLAFVEVALVQGMAGSIQALLDEKAPKMDPHQADAAIFYSISNTQKGLKQISFGDFLIKRAVQSLSREFPKLKIFATLSPIPGYRRWLDGLAEEELAAAFQPDDLAELPALTRERGLKQMVGELLSKGGWAKDAAVASALRRPLKALAARYLVSKRSDGQPLDSVARFHLRNGARLERLNWLGDASANGMAQSCGLMVNYRYVVDEIEGNHEAYMKDGHIALGQEMRGLLRNQRDASGARRRLLSIG